MIGTTAALLRLPDWCWQTYYEVLTYVEQISDDEEDSIRPLLSRLVRRGLIEKKLAPQLRPVTGPRMIPMYKRAPQ